MTRHDTLILVLAVIKRPELANDPRHTGPLFSTLLKAPDTFSSMTETTPPHQEDTFSGILDLPIIYSGKGTLAFHG